MHFLRAFLIAIILSLAACSTAPAPLPQVEYAKP